MTTPIASEPELPALPPKRRAMFCTKCGYSGPTAHLASPRGAPCERCDYTAFVQEVDYNDDEMRAYALAALSSRSGSAAETAKWKLVPVEPTAEMLRAGHKVTLDTVGWDRLKYQAMLSAAPQPPSRRDNMSTIPTEPSAERCEFPGCPNCPGVDRACKFAPAPPQEAPGVREALEELVALKDLKDWLDTHAVTAEWSQKRNEYLRRKPAAWAAARAALSGKKD